MALEVIILRLWHRPAYGIHINRTSLQRCAADKAVYNVSCQRARLYFVAMYLNIYFQRLHYITCHKCTLHMACRVKSKHNRLCLYSNSLCIYSKAICCHSVIILMPTDVSIVRNIRAWNRVDTRRTKNTLHWLSLANVVNGSRKSCFASVISSEILFCSLLIV